MAKRTIVIFLFTLAVASCGNQVCNHKEKPRSLPFPHAGIVAR